MYLKSWGIHDDGRNITFKEVKTTFCAKNDLNDKEGSNESAKFYKTRS